MKFTLNAAGQRTITVKLSKKALKAMRKAKIKRIKPKLAMTVTDAERQKRTAPRTSASSGSSRPARGAVRGAPAGRSAAALVPSDPPRTVRRMSLCFIEPQDAIRVIAESVGREARRQLLGELVRAWVDEIPEEELASHYAKAVADLDEHDLSMLAAWHASLEVGMPIANKEFLVNAFPALGDNRREALKIAAGFRGEDAFNAGVAEEQALETVLPWLSKERCTELVARVPRALLLGPAGLARTSGDGPATRGAARRSGRLPRGRRGASGRTRSRAGAGRGRAWSRTGLAGAVAGVGRPRVHPQLEAGAALAAVGVVGRGEPRVGDGAGAVLVEQRRPHGLGLVVARAGGADGGERERRALARPRRHGAHRVDAAPVGLAPRVAALAEAADLVRPARRCARVPLDRARCS